MAWFGGRGKKAAGGKGLETVGDFADHTDATGPIDATEADERGPWDVADLHEPSSETRLNLGSVWMAMPRDSAAQVQAELGPTGEVRAVHLVTESGRLTAMAFAAPRSPGQWREVAGEMAASLREAGTLLAIEDGPWGRELLGTAPEGLRVRFIGVDGPRWMLRLTAVGTQAAAEALREIAHEVLGDTVVIRGDEPMPVRSPLPISLPEAMLAQMRAAQVRQLQAQQAALAEQQSRLRTATGGQQLRDLGVVPGTPANPPELGPASDG